MKMEFNMKRLKHKLMQDDGGIDFVQLIVGIMIISIATLGTFQSLFYGYDQLDYQMRYRKALSIARGQVEYWQGRIHTDFPNAANMNGNLGSPRVFSLENRDPTTSRDDIECEVAYSKIEAIPNPENPADIDHWDIRVIVTWYEPGKSEDEGDAPNTIELYAPMVPATL
jgi:hypothetical protein